MAGDRRSIGTGLYTLCHAFTVACVASWCQQEGGGHWPPPQNRVAGEGDVIRGLPVLARVAEAGGLEMRVFPRDENQDIMNEFLKNGEWMSIPTAVFYTRDHRYICHWIERPEVADREMEEIEKAIRAENPGINDQDFGRERRDRTAARAKDWQQASVEELIALLNHSLA